MKNILINNFFVYFHRLNKWYWCDMGGCVGTPEKRGNKPPSADAVNANGQAISPQDVNIAINSSVRPLPAPPSSPSMYSRNK